MKDILIIGLVGVLWELLPSNSGELITVVLFLLLMVATIARTPRSNDIVVICGVGLLSELVLADSRNGVTIALFGWPLFRLLVHKLATQEGTKPGASRQPSWNVFRPGHLGQWLLGGLGILGDRIATRQFAFEFVAVVGMLTLGIGAAFYLTLGLGVSREVMGYGALSYALGAVGFKGLLYSGLVVPVLHKHLTRSWLAIAQGLVSAISELGAAALFFLFVVPKLSLTELIGFGAAAGIIEALVIPLMSIVGISVLGGTPVEKHAAEQQAQDLNASPGAVMILPVVERGVTMTLHAASRALVYAATFLGNVAPALLAVSLFASIDGLAYYALLSKWKVHSCSIAIKFYALVAIAAGIQLLMLLKLHDSLW